MKNTNKAVAYCRTASTEQTRESASLAAQQDRINLLAEQLNLKVVKRWQVVGSSRSGLKEMLEYCTEHSDIKYLVASSPDRISRSIKLYNDYTAKLRRMGVQVFTGSPADILRHNFLQSYKEATYSDQLSNRVKRGMRLKVEQGLSLSRPPLGYSATKVRGLYRPNKLGKSLASILQAIANGTLSIKEACKKLNNLTTSSTGKTLNKAQFTRLVTNPYYAGLVSYNGQTFNGLHEPLLSNEQYKSIKQLLRGVKQ